MTAPPPEATADSVAADLLAARRARRVPDTVTGMPASIAAGAQVQVATARMLGAARPAGFKIGATSTAMQAALGVTHPIAGFMTAEALHGSGSTLAFADLLNPGVECELAVHLQADLPPGAGAQAREAVGELFAGIEVVERRLAPSLAGNPHMLVADRMYHAAAILGSPFAGWRDLDLCSLAGSITVNGVVCGSGVGGSLLGDPMAALAWLADSAEVAAFGGLRAGMVVMLGSVTLPVWLDGPAEVRVSFPPLGDVVLSLV